MTESVIKSADQTQSDHLMGSMALLFEESNRVRTQYGPGGEAILLREASQGSVHAANLVAMYHAPFAITVARKYLWSGIPEDELCSISVMGLRKAALGFEYNKGVRFISFAVWWCRQAVGKYVDDSRGGARLPANRIRDMERYRREATEAGLSLDGYLATLGSKIRDRVTMDMEMLNPSSLESSLVSGPDESLSYSDIIGFESGVDHSVDSAKASDRLSMYIDSLPEKESVILRMCFGIGYPAPMTLREVGSEMGITRERVRQIRDSGTARLRHKFPDARNLIGTYVSDRNCLRGAWEDVS